MAITRPPNKRYMDREELVSVVDAAVIPAGVLERGAEEPPPKAAPTVFPRTDGIDCMAEATVLPADERALIELS